ncbi:MAG TPA: DUF389 domain-containing protein [Acidimicrobiales bacterium]|nr:DUF389 domain-containing protein [Acidimicrobiales bacterium]
MVHLRLIVPSHKTAAIFEYLASTPGVAHVVELQATRTTPAGTLVLCDVAREAANEVVEWLQRQDIHHDGAITVESLEAVVSDAAERASAEAPGHGADALIWEEIEGRARAESIVTTSFLVLMGIAAVIAGIGILLDAPILIVGAMVVGPEYGPLAALCVAAVRRRSRPAVDAGMTLAGGLLLATFAALVTTLAFRWSGLAPASYDVSERELTAFISHPDGMAAVVAVLAGVVGMLSLTQARSGALIGVLVSVTTIPAAANIGVAAAYREWPEVRGAALQLGLNLAGLVAAGIATLAVQSRATASRRPRP